MSEEFFKENLQKYIDGELNNPDRRKFEEILQSCPVARMNYEQEQKFHDLIRHHIVKEEAPYEVREKMLEQFQKPSLLARLRLVPVSFATGLAVMVFVFSFVLRANAAFPVFSSSVENHMEYMEGHYPIEIASNDYKEVSTWFEDKLDYEAKLPDLTSKGITLLGARICHLKDRKGAFLMYEKDGHEVSVFVMDSRNIKVPASKTVGKKGAKFYVKNVDGYNSILCLNQKPDRSVGCIYVSNLPESELMELVG